MVDQPVAVVSGVERFECPDCGAVKDADGLCPLCDKMYAKVLCSDCGSPVENGDAYKKTLIRGVGKDAPLDVNEHGGKQSKMEYDFTQLDPRAMFQLAGILKYGSDKYGRDNWKRITPEEHLNHALQHIFAYLAGDKQDDHLGHAFCRLMFAIVVDRDGLSI